jgi:hypothetical protein
VSTWLVGLPTPRPGPHDNPYRAFFNGRLEDPAILGAARYGDAPIDAAFGTHPARSGLARYHDPSALSF